MTDKWIELWGNDFDMCRELERERLRVMPDVPALKVYDALRKSNITFSDLFAVMEELGCKCDREDDGEFVRLVEVDDDGRLILDDHWRAIEMPGSRRYTPAAEEVAKDQGGLVYD
jgi:hypothetical protein